MSNILTRALTGALFVVLIVSSIILSHYFFSIVFLIITILCLEEYYSLLKSQSISPAKILGIIVGSLLFLSFSLTSAGLIEIKYLYLNIPMILLVFIFELFRKNNSNITNISYTITGVFYIALPLAILNFFYYPAFNPGGSSYNILLGFFILVWVHDIGAYLVGSAIGRRKLFERISPQKTWEGSIGGAIICLICASFLESIFGDSGTASWIIIAAIVVLFGTLGDLAESMIKRNLNVKDSGKLLPGHGGVLDRFDSVLFASPTVFVYLLMST